MTSPTSDGRPATAAEADDELVPISVRLGQVVPPEDPEDWTQPLTWVAAAGMLAAPLVALLWFWLFPPADADALTLGTILVATALALGGVLTGATQQGGLRASTATVAAGLVRRPGDRDRRAVDGRRAPDRSRLADAGAGLRRVRWPGWPAAWRRRPWRPDLPRPGDDCRDCSDRALPAVGVSWLVASFLFGPVAAGS